MSFFSDIIDTIFGGTDTSAQEAQQAANVAAQQRIDVTSGQARSDVLDLFPRSDLARNQSFQAALDVLGQSIPAQINALQQGNVGAQQNLLAGLPQFRNAILGGQVDFSALQPQAVTPQSGFTSQTLPGFAIPQSSFTSQTPQQSVAQNSLQQALSGLLGGSANFSGEGFSPTAEQSFQAEGGFGTTPGANALLSLFGLDQPGGPIGGTTNTASNIATLVSLLSGTGGLGLLAGGLGGLSDAFSADERAAQVTGGVFDSSGLSAALSGATSGIFGTSAQQQLDDFIGTFIDDFSAVQRGDTSALGSGGIDFGALDAAISGGFTPGAPSVSTGNEFTSQPSGGDSGGDGGFDPGGGTTGASGFDDFT